MTTHIHLEGTDRLTINTFAYRPVETNNDGHILERIDQPGLTEPISHEHLKLLWPSNTFRHEPQYFSKTKSLLRMSIIDSTPGERAPDGSYRVRCEMLIQRPFLPRTDVGPS